MVTATTTAEQILEDLAQELEIPKERYEAAEGRYRAIASWLERPQSSVRTLNPQIYPQGSFRLGTAIKPADASEHYDLDIVCEFMASKEEYTQEKLKELLGGEIEGYAERYGMAEPGESRRCWTLDYAEGAQFHMDLLPAVPDGIWQRQILQARSMDAAWSDTAIAITDRDHLNFTNISDEWPSSNPKAYSKWFFERMRFAEARRSAFARMVKADAEDIPEHKIKTPLQKAIQILKRHRDVTFADRPNERPISIILTTLATQAYRQETQISHALLSILHKMDHYIEIRHEFRNNKLSEVAWIANPTDARENFADRWVDFPERKRAFYDWLRQARADFQAAAQAHSAGALIDALGPRIGHDLIRRVARKRHAVPSTALTQMGGFKSRLATLVHQITSAPHRRPVPWNENQSGEVRIVRALCTRPGFRPALFASGGPPLPKNADLTFEAATSIRRPFKVYWQVTNTGAEALQTPGGPRGNFHEEQATRGTLVRRESTKYSGSHGVECFIVRDGKMLARSGVFVVNIA